MKRILLIILFAFLLAGGIGAFVLYGYIFRSNVTLTGAEETYLLLPTGSDFEDVVSIFETHGYLRNISSFTWLAKRMHYPEMVRPGRYRIHDGMSNLELVRLLRSGKQTPVKVTFVNIRTKEDLSGKIARQIEADSNSLLTLLRDPDYLARYGVNTYTALVLFIPNTYELYWNTSAPEFISRMAKEKERFWNASRQEKCRNAGLSVSQAVTLASIIEKETNQNAEKPIIAGVYMNRLKKGWLLQADPTVIFAWSDYSIKRLKGDHLKIQSPYNTYLYPGLPPGPICLPSIATVDAVLNYSKHNYLYFCAKDDLSGYHVFAPDYASHTRNAKKYQAAIKKQGIR